MITSEKNPKIQLVRALIERSKERKKHQAFVVEGVRLIEETLNAGWPTELVLIAENLSPRGLALAETFSQSGSIVEEVPLSIMQKLAGTESPQGILAIVKQPQAKTPEKLDFALICDEIRDPGNLGTILRTADAVNVQAVFCSPGTTDPFAPKVVRSGMGAHFHIPILKYSWEEIKKSLQNDKLNTCMATADAAFTLWETNLSKPTAILVGNEAFGPSVQGKALANQGISIPMPGRSESLNAAMAAGILLYEVVRQRNQKF